MYRDMNDRNNSLNKYYKEGGKVSLQRKILPYGKIQEINPPG